MEELIVRKIQRRSEVQERGGLEVVMGEGKKGKKSQGRKVKLTSLIPTQRHRPPPLPFLLQLCSTSRMSSQVSFTSRLHPLEERARSLDTARRSELIPFVLPFDSAPLSSPLLCLGDPHPHLLPS